jgi:hypothetical protein
MSLDPRAELRDALATIQVLREELRMAKEAEKAAIQLANTAPPVPAKTSKAVMTYTLSAKATLVIGDGDKIDGSWISNRNAATLSVPVAVDVHGPNAQRLATTNCMGHPVRELAPGVWRILCPSHGTAQFCAGGVQTAVSQGHLSDTIEVNVTTTTPTRLKDTVRADGAGLVDPWLFGIRCQGGTLEAYADGSYRLIPH